MAARDDLFLRGARRKLQYTDSVFRHEGQERGKGNFTMSEREVILVQAAAVVDVGAKHAGFAEGEGLGVVVPAEEFLGLGVAEIVPVADDVGGVGVEDVG